LEDHLVFSVLGPHAQESLTTIFSRKQQDITSAGLTFWMSHSIIDVQTIQQSGHNGNLKFCWLISASSRYGAKMTSTNESAIQYSPDRLSWFDLPMNISPVTGKIDRGAWALVFKELVLSDVPLDLWDYATLDHNPIVIRQGFGTHLVKKHRVSEGIKSRYRRILGVATLVSPFIVWLR
jgi:hypothetical protein